MNALPDSVKRYARKPFAFRPEYAALLVIDMQRFFLDKSSHAYLPLARPIVPRIKQLVTAFREHKLPVIFTRHALKQSENPGIMQEWWRDVIRNKSRFSHIIKELKAFRNCEVIRKTRYSAFHGTKLEQILKQHKINQLVITGVMTHLCCETTAREAFLKDYRVFFTADATASENMDLHLSSLKTLSHGFAVPVTAKEIINTLE
ncbi:MAG: isochorismatase family protein [Candidatus Brocadiia bacterium]